jgi:hypothetical protein
MLEKRLPVKRLNIPDTADMRCFLPTLSLVLLLLTYSDLQSQNCSTSLIGGTASSAASGCAYNGVLISVSGATTGTDITYQWQMSNDGVVWYDVSAATSSAYTARDLPAYFRRKSICAYGGSAVSTAVFIAQNSLNACYCTPVVSSNCNTGYMITNVSFGTLNNSSGCGTNGYTNYSGIVTPVNLQVGVFQPISVAVGAGASTKYLHCFIDFNQNGSFESQEYSILINPVSNVYTGSIRIPFGARLGVTRMRLIFNGSSGVTACSPGSSAEAEDYDINLTANTNATGFVYYVKPSAPGSNSSGLSWSNAVTSVKTALDKAMEGDTIKVAAGTYYTGTGVTSGFSMKDSVVLLGGYPATGTPTDADRNYRTDKTILSGYASSSSSTKNLHVVFASGLVRGALLDGFILENAGPNTGTTNSEKNGSGIRVENGASVTVKNTVVRNTNTYDGEGTVISVYQGAVKFINCIAEKNKAKYLLLFEERSEVDFSNFLVARNSATQLMQADSSTVKFTNATIANNVLFTSLSKAGAHSAISFYNSITAPNAVSYYYGTGPYNYDTAEIRLNVASTFYANCLTQNITTGTNLLTGVMPRFNDSSNIAGADGNYFTSDDGYMLQNPYSPAINAGDNSYVALLPFDITGSSRIFQSTADIGAYELQQNRAHIPAVVYVNAVATGLNNGSSWANAFTDIHRALEVSSDTIKIAAGTYYPFKATANRPYWVENKRVIAGGYPATGNPTNTDRNYNQYPTIINAATSTGGREVNVIRGLNLDSTSVIDGLTITNTGGDYSNYTRSAVYYSYCNNPIIRNSRFTANPGQVFYGLNNTDPLFDSCRFEDNILPGGSYYTQFFVVANSTSTRLQKCVFQRNSLPTWTSTAGEFGRILMSYATNTVIDSCLFYKNRATVLFNWNGSPSVTNSKFIGNSAENATVDIRNINAAPVFRNCVFTDSSTYESFYGAIMNNYLSSPSFFDCRFMNGKSSLAGVVYNDSSSIALTRCVIERCGFPFYNKNGSNMVLSEVITHGGYGTFMYNFRSTATLNNSVVVNMSAASSYGVIYNDMLSSVTVNNSIFWKNFTQPTTDTTAIKARADIKNFNGSQSVAHNSMFEYSYGATGPGNTIKVDPRFINFADPTGADRQWLTADDGLQLCNCSPAINSGDNTYTSSTSDILTAGRILDGTVDRGAFEFSGGTSNPTAKTYYVNAAATSNNAGTSWQNAYNDLQLAFNNPCADTIRIASGVYRPSVQARDSVFNITRQIAIYGGYDPQNPVDAIRDIDVSPTILSGDVGLIGDSSDNSYSIMRAIYIDSLTIDNILFSDANKNTNVTGAYGSALFCQYIQSVKINNCRFFNNINNLDGGGLHIVGCNNVSVNRTVFKGNKASSGGGLVLSGNDNGTSTISSCIFDHNVATYQGGGVSHSNGTSDGFSNCLFYRNEAFRGSGVFVSRLNGNFRNCTFSYNKLAGGAPGSYAGGIYFGSGGAPLGAQPSIGNCIFVGNSATSLGTQACFYDMYYAPSGNPPSNCYLDLPIHHSAVTSYPIYYYGGGLLDPSLIKFRNIDNAIGVDNKWFTADDGLQLSVCSGGIDAGDDTNASTTDLAGRNRKYGAKVDLGAYEFSGTPEWGKLLSTANDSLIANREYTDAEGWTHYYKDCFYLMSIKKRGQNIGAVGNNAFEVKIKTTAALGSGQGTDLASANYVSSGQPWRVMNRYWKVKSLNQLADSVEIRFPYSALDYRDVNGSNPLINSHEKLVFFKVDPPFNPLDLAVPSSNFHQYLNDTVASLKTWKHVVADTIHVSQYFVTDLNGGGGAGGSAPVVSCTIITWIGAVNTAWENAANWSCGVVPNASTNVVIPPGFNVVITSNVTVNTLSIGAASNVTVSTGFNLTVLH